MWWTKLMPAVGTLTRARSLISGAETEVETPKLWAVCSITKNQYWKSWWANLNAHTDASSLCASSRITSTNRWNEMSGACYECWCWSCWLVLMYWTLGWFLWLENFLIKALHLVGGQSQLAKVKVKDKDRDYVSEEVVPSALQIVRIEHLVSLSFNLKTLSESLM